MKCFAGWDFDPCFCWFDRKWKAEMGRWGLGLSTWTRIGFASIRLPMCRFHRRWRSRRQLRPSNSLRITTRTIYKDYRIAKRGKILFFFYWIWFICYPNRVTVYFLATQLQDSEFSLQFSPATITAIMVCSWYLRNLIKWKKQLWHDYSL